MLLQCVDEDGVGHLDTVVECDEVCIIRLELLSGNGAKGAVEIVYRLNEIAGEALDGEVFGGLSLAFCSLL